jgi:hypothetical protein
MTSTSSKFARASASGLFVGRTVTLAAAGCKGVVGDVRSLDQVNAATADVDARRKAGSLRSQLLKP